MNIIPREPFRHEGSYNLVTLTILVTILAIFSVIGVRPPYLNGNLYCFDLQYCMRKNRRNGENLHICRQFHNCNPQGFLALVILGIYNYVSSRFFNFCFVIVQSQNALLNSRNVQNLMQIRKVLFVVCTIYGRCILMRGTYLLE